MTYQQNDLLREKLKLEIVWFNTDMIWLQLPPNTVTIKRKTTIITTIITINICQSHQLITIPLLWQFKNIFTKHYTHHSCNFFLWTFSLLLSILTSLSLFLVQTLLLRFQLPFHHLLPQLRILLHPWRIKILLISKPL